MSPKRQKAIFFDLMGTCCDWLSSLLPLISTLPPHPLISTPSRQRALALTWRAAFFAEIHARHARGEPPEDIDVTHRRILKERGIAPDEHGWAPHLRDQLVAQWHVQTPWSDVIPALEKLRADATTTWFLVVLANGTMRLQLDIAASSAIPFHTLLSSELLGCTKPGPEIYREAMRLVRLPAEDCVMLASHLYDLEAAKKVGMTTVYVHRDTEDVGIEIGIESCKNEGAHGFVDLYVDGRE
ncbi:HAD-like protein, partial [Melanomma pulvis-pyrius CBS 109.77]